MSTGSVGAVYLVEATLPPPFGALDRQTLGLLNVGASPQRFVGRADSTTGILVLTGEVHSSAQVTDEASATAAFTAAVRAGLAAAQFDAPADMGTRTWAIAPGDAELVKALLRGDA